MRATRRTAILGSVVAALSGGGLYWHFTRPPSAASVRARLSGKFAAPDGPLDVFHLGHSLVNRDMPAMLAQLAPPGHSYHSQLGWGATLKAHWGDDVINGFEAENAHSRFRPAHEAMKSAEYDAIVLTEMVEIRDALRYYDSPKYLALWAKEALAARPDVRLYPYETWHRLDDREGWLERLDRDIDRYWLSRLLGPGLARLPVAAHLQVIPAGQVLAAVVRAIEAQGGVGNARDRTDLFARNPDGSIDPIHLNDLGNYLVAVVHCTVLYHIDPVGLPFALTRADDTPANPPSPELARLMQETAATVVRKVGLSGIAT
jgi:hypothetical protein